MVSGVSWSVTWDQRLQIKTRTSVRDDEVQKLSNEKYIRSNRAQSRFAKVSRPTEYARDSDHDQTFERRSTVIQARN